MKTLVEAESFLADEHLGVSPMMVEPASSSGPPTKIVLEHPDGLTSSELPVGYPHLKVAFLQAE